MVLKSHDVMNSDYIYRLHYAKFLSSRLTNFVPFSKKHQVNKQVAPFTFQQEITPTQRACHVAAQNIQFGDERF